MKYWLYCGVKVAAWLVFMVGLQNVVLHLYPLPAPVPGVEQSLFAHDMSFTFLVLSVWFVGAALLFVLVWDQRRRCRSCLRKLIMPVATGTWGRTVFGRPRTEWICRYGHGTLTIEELQITGRQLPDWHPHDGDIWKELESYYQAHK